MVTIDNVFAASAHAPEHMTTIGLFTMQLILGYSDNEGPFILWIFTIRRFLIHYLHVIVTDIFSTVPPSLKILGLSVLEL